jgi:pimeloyl-ACP methyl ester carboxylesterase/DNA-binding CsgD family transcriptional regulator
MPALRQHISFCQSADGTRIAFAKLGSGPPLVRAAHFLTHLEHDLASPVWRPWLDELSRDHTLVRYDGRGCGLSDRECQDLSLEAALSDLDAVVNATGVEKCSLLGCSQGSAVSIAYAAAHPDRVERLVLYGGYARGLMKRNPSVEQVEEGRMLIDLIRLGWGRENPAFRQVFTSLFLPDGTPEQVLMFNELEHLSTTPEMAARIVSSFGQIDVSALAREIRCPTLVLHSEGDARVPYEEGRLLAGLISGARFATLHSRNHILLAQEPAFRICFDYIHDFLGRASGQESEGFSGLTSREREILELLAHGLDNWQIAARLSLSEKTVRNNTSRIFDKLGVHTRAQTIVKARQAGFAASPLRPN